MTIQSYVRRTLGATPIVWGQPSAAGVTNNITLDALASGSAREGVYADLGEYWDEDYLLEAMFESGTAPTAGANIDVYLIWSRDGTTWPGGTTGADAAWPSDGDEDQWAKQLGVPAISVVSTNDGNTLQKQNPVVIRARARYVAVVVDNNWNQAIRDETTATDNDSRVKLTPIRSLAADAL